MITFGLNLFGGAGSGDIYYLNIGTELDVDTEAREIDLEAISFDVEVDTQGDDIELNTEGLDIALTQSMDGMIIGSC